jgi:uncharacterized protein YndB with AHSA1/START domain
MPSTASFFDDDLDHVLHDDAPTSAMVRTALLGDRSLRFLGRYAATRTACFDALTVAGAVARWLPPPEGWTLEGACIDPRVGGAYRYTRRGSGRDVDVFGSYRSIERGRGFDAIELWSTRGVLQERHVVCALESCGAGDHATTLEFTVTWASSAARDLAMLAGAEVEGIDALERLHSAVAARRPTGLSSPALSLARAPGRWRRTRVAERLRA